MIQTEQQYCVYCREPVTDSELVYHQECKELVDKFKVVRDKIDNGFASLRFNIYDTNTEIPVDVSNATGMVFLVDLESGDEIQKELEFTDPENGIVRIDFPKTDNPKTYQVKMLLIEYTDNQKAFIPLSESEIRVYF